MSSKAKAITVRQKPWTMQWNSKDTKQIHCTEVSKLHLIKIWWDFILQLTGYLRRWSKPPWSIVKKNQNNLGKLWTLNWTHFVAGGSDFLRFKNACWRLEVSWSMFKAVYMKWTRKMTQICWWHFITRAKLYLINMDRMVIWALTVPKETATWEREDLWLCAGRYRAGFLLFFFTYRCSKLISHV